MITIRTVALASFVATVILVTGGARADDGRCPRLAYNPNSLVHVDPVILKDKDKVDLNKADTLKLAGLPSIHGTRNQNALVRTLMNHRPYSSREDMEARSTLPCVVVMAIWPRVTVN